MNLGLIQNAMSEVNYETSQLLMNNAKLIKNLNNGKARRTELFKSKFVRSFFTFGNRF